MAKTVGPVTDELLRRARDPNATGTSRTIAQRFLTQAEALTSVGLRAHLETITFTAERARLIFNLSEINSRIVFVDSVRADGREIDFAPYDSLAVESPQWFRRQGDRFESYSIFGRQLLVLYPGVDRLVDVSLTCYVAPDPITGETDVTTLEDRWHPTILDWAELLMLLRQRRLDQIAPLVERLRTQLVTHQRGMKT